MLTYRAGTWYAVAAGDTVALMAPDVDAATLTAVWQAMATGDGLAAVLEGLVGSFGASLGSLPPFAVAIRDAGGGVRVIVRGACTASVDVPGAESVQLNGLGVTTWTDRTLPQAEAVRLSVAAESGPALPLAAGVVPAGSLVWTPRADPARDAAPAAEEEPAHIPAVPVVPESTAVAPARPEPDPPAPAVAREPAAVPDAAPSPVVAPEPIRSSADTLTFTSVTLSPGEVAPVLGAATADDTRGYDDFIFGETRVSTVEDAAVRTLGEEDLVRGVPASAPASALVPAGDHDGETLSAEQFAALLAGRASAPTAAPGTPPPALPAPAPVLVLSTGQRCVLDRSAVVGRRPRALHATGTLPHLVTVPSPQQDISRSHVELRVEGEDILALDLDTVNGTRLLRAGQEPVRLGPGQPTLLVGGDRLDLGDGVVLSFEGL